MCTVSYIPLPDQGFAITSNRDEQASRGAAKLVKKSIDQTRIVYPEDPISGGTWLAASDQGSVICILNGAFEPHVSRLPYRQSRGLLAFAFFHENDVSSFIQKFDFTGIEPFTAVIVESSKLYELRWDEQNIHLRELDAAKAHIWSSCTLYTAEDQDVRQDWFNDYLSSASDITPDAVLKFHKSAGVGDERIDLVMNRKGIVQTTSISQVTISNSRVSLRFESFLDGQVLNARLVRT